MSSQQLQFLNLRNIPARLTAEESVLKTPSDTDAAYSRLVAACAIFAANRTGANRAELQAILVNAGIQKLQEASVTNLQALSGLGHDDFYI
jgi:uncharacterized lipoprotein NlpE involved in copper resistance